MEKEEILVSKFTALASTIFSCSIKSKTVSSVEGIVVFTRFCRSHLLRHVHFRQKQNNFKGKLARLLSDKQYIRKPKSGGHETILGIFLLCFAPAISLVLMMPPAAVQLPHHSSSCTDPRGQGKTSESPQERVNPLSQGQSSTAEGGCPVTLFGAHSFQCN